jgi:DNA invertase Pin-like site-specific DNA recombinase
MEVLRENDTLVVWKLDRLGRSVKQLVDLVGALRDRGVQFRSLRLCKKRFFRRICG